GGANGGRLALAPQKDWEVNQPAKLARALEAYEAIRQAFNGSRSDGKHISLADLIVLGGCAGVEEAARRGGHAVTVPFTPGRMDASQDETDAASFAVLEPKADGFRNYFTTDSPKAPAEALVDRADLLTLTVPEMTVLVGGLRALDANAGGSKAGVFTDKPGTLSNDFFVNLLDVSTKWQKSAANEGLYEGHDRANDELEWTATTVDLIFGANAELRAVAEVYATADSEEKFVKDFVAAWSKVMDLDRYEPK
ncbi:MAG: peroxidase family protein, partial [Gammaproteobacteria bacterium]